MSYGDIMRNRNMEYKPLVLFCDYYSNHRYVFSPINEDYRREILSKFRTLRILLGEYQNTFGTDWICAQYYENGASTYPETQYTINKTLMILACAMDLLEDHSKLSAEMMRLCNELWRHFNEEDS